MKRNTPSETFSPVNEVPTRRKIPEHLYIIIDSVVFPTLIYEDASAITHHTGDFHAKLEFACEQLTPDHLRAHLTRRN
jgi:hypothetical protein